MGSTMSDIAKRAGTSVAAVSVILNGARSKTLRVGPETRERILRAAEELGYRRNPLASALATGRSKVLALILPEPHSLAQNDPFFSLVTNGVISLAAQQGYSTVLYSSSLAEASREDLELVNRLVAGVVLASPPPYCRIFDECRSQKIPFATIVAGPECAPFTVDSDDYQGGLLATRHLIELGHRRIAHLEGRGSVSTTEPRRRGYFDALADYEIAIDRDLCTPGNFNRADGYSATRELLRLPQHRSPTAVFAGNDLSAHGAIEAIYDAGLRVPDDVSVVGYDDTWYATVSRPALTSVNMNVQGIGEEACKLLLSFIEQGSPVESHVVLPVSLTIRESTGPLR